MSALIIAAGPAAAAAAIDAACDATDKLEETMLQMEQVDCELQHFFATDVYVRQITMPGGTVVVGHRHLTDHVNNVVSGKALVSMKGFARQIDAPHVFVSEPGVRKALYIIEDMVWQTVHVIDLKNPPTHADDIRELVEKLEPTLIEKSNAWFSHQERKEIEEMTKLQETVAKEAPFCRS